MLCKPGSNQCCTLLLELLAKRGINMCHKLCLRAQLRLRVLGGEIRENIPLSSLTSHSLKCRRSCKPSGRADLGWLQPALVAEPVGHLLSNIFEGLCMFRAADTRVGEYLAWPVRCAEDTRAV